MDTIQGDLLFDAMRGNNNMIRYYENPITKVLVEQDLKLIKNLVKNKNIKTFLVSANFQFKLVTRRKFKIVKWFFSSYKNEMKNLRNNRKENLLKVACKSRGLNQNIINLFLVSGLFGLSNVKFNNRKVKKIFSN